MAVLYTSEAQRGEVFAAHFATELPDLPFHRDTAPDPAAIEYLVAWTAPPDVASRYPNLKLLFSVGAGVDQLDLAALPRKVDVVRMLEPGLAEQMQEYVTLAVLALHRDLPRYIHQRPSSLWQPGRNVPARERRVGIMGLGQLGKAVLQALTPFGFPLAGWSRSARQIPGVETFTDLSTFLSRTDILICLLPLTPDTAGILDAGLFSKLPPGAALVHAGRGRQLDHNALLEALASGQLSNAWLDVTEPEPLPAEHPFWNHQQIVLTPHIACQTRADDGARHVIAGIRAHKAGLPIPGLVDRTRGY
ncbi:glyoxylate/hydroxypyruvate reductase A [Rhizobium lemnae]|uniref:2-hydroxyacid dehydrogenase n=1 Tax=Rhizobium lemnae TaxID=1214924 RepID=A0ABV8ECL7_9HYPH|nr:glyoxylate/hydroxypyruvate reductase A [Rhizobium lemnae]MCJ8507138.1 glyoxylate/hydroxypyruvate reductase A [Rhizobium lemnae]